MRLDIFLVDKNFFTSRNKANEFIKQGKIKVNGKIIKKPSFKIDNENIQIEVLDTIYVSRAALKLKYFIDEIGLDVTNLVALDVGSSTGGFVQVLLEKGIKKVVSVDVGSEQLDKRIKKDSKVIVFENTDIRDFKTKDKFDIITCDISFISVLKIVSYLNILAKDKIIILFKPQFEVGKEAKRDSNGVVVDKKAIQKARDNFINKLKNIGWKLVYNSKSKISGKQGNIEELFLWKKV